MKKFKGTSGEWWLPHFANDEVQCDCTILMCEQYEGAIATVHYNTGERYNDNPPLEEAKANARLIAAAPDLLIALHELVDSYAKLIEDPSNNLDATPYINAQSAIIKALEESKHEIKGGTQMRPVERIEEKCRAKALRALYRLDFTPFYHVECMHDYTKAIESIHEQFIKNYDE